jgi:hypothetical protein
MARGLALATLASLGGLVAAFASCATNDEAELSRDPEHATVPEASAPDGQVDASEDVAVVDAGCDAADTTCTTHVVTCDEVDWCGVESGVNPLYILKAVWGSGKNDVWAVGSGGAVTHYDGTKWTVIPTGIKNTFVGVWGSSANDVYVISSTSDIVLHAMGTGDGTASIWTSIPTPAVGAYTAPLYAIWGTSASDVRIAARAHSLPGVNGHTGHMFLRKDLDDGGVGWQSVAGNAFYTRGLWGSSASDVWQIGDNNGFERAKTMHGVPRATPYDAGAGYIDPLEWTAVDSQANVVLDAIWGSSANDVWTVGSSGTVRHITQNDYRWEPVTVPTTQNLHAVWGTGPNDVWMVGDAGTILHYDGTSFKDASAQFPIGRKPNLYGIWGSGPNDVWIVGDAITLHYTGPKAGAQGGGQ